MRLGEKRKIKQVGLTLYEISEIFLKAAKLIPRPEQQDWFLMLRLCAW